MSLGHGALCRALGKAPEFQRTRVTKCKLKRNNGCSSGRSKRGSRVEGGRREREERKGKTRRERKAGEGREREGAGHNGNENRPN